MNVLLTGGLGYIGSHIAVELLNAGHSVIIIDNLSNSSRDVESKIEKITSKKCAVYEGDIRNKELLKSIFTKHNVSSVIHLAGYKTVGESFKLPLDYYDNNINSTVILLEAMNDCGIKNIMFSSSATVYAESKIMPISEGFPTSASNPYSRTKLMAEEILKDVFVSDNSWNIAILRYSNPIGAHDSGLIGDKPKRATNNLMPYLLKGATGKIDKVSICGNDHETKDGTSVRDYIHVMDLASGHVKMLERFKTNPGLVTYNLGSGRGHSVLEIINTLNSVCGDRIKYDFTSKRPGDLGIFYSSSEKAKNELSWTAGRTLEDMCYSSYNFEVRSMETNKNNSGQDLEQ